MMSVSVWKVIVVDEWREVHYAVESEMQGLVVGQ